MPECAQGDAQRGDWVVPTFNYELRTQKPVLLYWLMMASYSLFGVNEFAARFPSALMAIGTTLVTFHLGRLLFNNRAGLLAGLMMATCLMFGVGGHRHTRLIAHFLHDPFAICICKGRDAACQRLCPCIVRHAHNASFSRRAIDLRLPAAAVERLRNDLQPHGDCSSRQRANRSCFADGDHRPVLVAR